ncbi:MAG: sodium:proton antiporter [Clostridia bacterium]|nr:sodium:proton antiporter [Clostridia bacterium]
MILVNYIASIFLIVLGFYTLIFKTDLIKIVIGLGIVDYGVNLLIVSVGFNPGGTAPIFTVNELDPGMFFVDPIPQALTLTSIVIGACVTALALSLVVRMREEYNTLDAREIRRLRG